MIELMFKVSLETIFHSCKIYHGFKKVQSVDLQLDLPQIETFKDSNNYNMQIYNMIYKKLQLEQCNDIFLNHLNKF